MAKYTVKSPLKLDGKRYEPGKTVEIKDDRADLIEPLVAAGILEAKKKKEKGDDGADLENA